LANEELRGWEIMAENIPEKPEKLYKRMPFKSGTAFPGTT
jgi:hypothetical protein